MYISPKPSHLGDFVGKESRAYILFKNKIREESLKSLRKTNKKQYYKALKEHYNEQFKIMKHFKSKRASKPETIIILFL